MSETRWCKRCLRNARGASLPWVPFQRQDDGWTLHKLWPYGALCMSTVNAFGPGRWVYNTHNDAGRKIAAGWEAMKQEAAAT